MKREEYIDVAKGILIILVVIGHAVPENSIFRIWIWSFHMPAFFIITGMLLNYSSFKRKSFKELVLTNVKKLLLPYAAFKCCGALQDRVTFGKTLNLKDIYIIPLRLTTIILWIGS